MNVEKCTQQQCTESERMTRMEEKIDKMFEMIVDVRVSQAKLENLRTEVEYNKKQIGKVQSEVETIKIDNAVMKRLATKREVHLSFAIAIASIVLSLVPPLIQYMGKKDDQKTHAPINPSDRVSGAASSSPLGAN